MEKNITHNRKNALRRLLYAFICVCLSAFAFMISFTGDFNIAKAETEEIPKITVESKTVHRGQTFTLCAYLEKNTGLVAMVLDLKYDKSAMSLVGVERGDGLKSHTFTTTNTETDEGFLIEPFRLLWDGTTQDTTTGLLVTFTFESKLSAPKGDYPVTLIYDSNNTNSEYGKPVAVEIENGVVTLISGEYTVVYKNYDGSELLRKDYNENDIPKYFGETPKRETDEKYSYTFKGWKGAVSNVENEVWYIAEYDTLAVEYQVTFYVDGEFFYGDIYGYNESVDLSNVPSKKNHNFSGWYLDEEYTQKVTFVRMPSKDLKLYGYMKFNIREDEIPKINLTFEKEENGVAYVGVYVSENPAISGLVLTLDYNKTALEFIGFDRDDTFGSMQFSYTNTEHGYNAEPFKFYWESAQNTYETGKILTLKFKIKENVSVGTYSVTFTYNENTDATFFNSEQELWYTKLDIIGANVPIGKLYHWYEETESGIGIDVTTEEGQFPDTILTVKRITRLVTIGEQSIVNVAGENTELKDVYFAKLYRCDDEINPNGRITVKIELTESQALCSVIAVCAFNENKELYVIESQVENGFVTFETDKLGEFAVIGNVVAGGIGGTIGAPTNTPIIIIASILLSMAAIGFALIVISKTKKNKQVFEYPKDK